nr:hypothetical protein [Burkholderia anthina]
MYQPPVEDPAFLPLTKCEVDFDRQNDAFRLIAVIEKALGIAQ